MEAGVTDGFVQVNIPLIQETLEGLADDVEFIATGKADDRKDGDAWERRCDAGLRVFRLCAALNHGEIHLAGCNLESVKVLQESWSAIEELQYGDHCEKPNEYRGPLHLPGEVGTLNEGLPLRKADEQYDQFPDVTAWQRALPVFSEESLSELSDDEPTTQLIRETVKLAREGTLTTKRERWGRFPDELRRLAKRLTRAAVSNAVPRPVASTPSPTIIASTGTAVANGSCSPAELRTDLGCSESALRNFRRKAGVGPWKRGARCLAGDRQAICKVAAQSSDGTIAANAKRLLATSFQQTNK